MRLAVLVATGSPWAYGVLESLREIVPELMILHYNFEAGGGYLGANEGSWRERRVALHASVARAHNFTLSRTGKLGYVELARRVREACREWRPDHLLSLYGGGQGFACALSGVRPYSVFTVGSDVSRLSLPWRMVTRWTFSRAAHVFANGDWLADQTRALAPGRRVQPLLLGIDLAKWPLGDPPTRPIRLIAPRGFKPVYRNEWILQALAQMPALEVDFETVFTSGGEGLDAARAFPLPPHIRVSFLGGVDQPRLCQEYQRGHAFLSMSASDGTATSLLEAMACGLTPILSDIPANRPWSERLCRSPEELTAALVRFLTGRAEGPTRADLRKRIESEADLRANMARLVASLAASRPGSPQCRSRTSGDRDQELE